MSLERGLGLFGQKNTARLCASSHASASRQLRAWSPTKFNKKPRSFSRNDMQNACACLFSPYVMIRAYRRIPVDSYECNGCARGRIYSVCCERSSAFLIRSFERISPGNAMRCTSRSDASSSCSPAHTLSTLPRAASAVPCSRRVPTRLAVFVF